MFLSNLFAECDGASREERRVGIGRLESTDGQAGFVMWREDAPFLARCLAAPTGPRDRTPVRGPEARAWRWSINPPVTAAISQRLSQPCRSHSAVAGMFSPAVVVVEPEGADEVVIEDDHEVGQTELDRELARCPLPFH